MAGDTSAQRLLEDVLGFARDYAGENLQIALKTNLGEFNIASVDLLGGKSDGAAKGSGLAGALGLKAAVIVRDGQGRAVANFGNPPATDYSRVALLVGAAALLLLLIVRGLRRG